MVYGVEGDFLWSGIKGRTGFIDRSSAEYDEVASLFKVSALLPKFSISATTKRKWSWSGGVGSPADPTAETKRSHQERRFLPPRRAAKSYVSYEGQSVRVGLATTVAKPTSNTETQDQFTRERWLSSRTAAAIHAVGALSEELLFGSGAENLEVSRHAQGIDYYRSGARLIQCYRTRRFDDDSQTDFQTDPLCYPHAKRQSHDDRESGAWQDAVLRSSSVGEWDH